MDLEVDDLVSQDVLSNPVATGIVEEGRASQVDTVVLSQSQEDNHGYQAVRTIEVQRKLAHLEKYFIFSVGAKDLVEAKCAQQTCGNVLKMQQHSVYNLKRHYKSKHPSLVNEFLAAIEGGSKRGKHSSGTSESDTAFKEKFSHKKALNLYYSPEPEMLVEDGLLNCCSLCGMKDHNQPTCPSASRVLEVCHKCLLCGSRGHYPAMCSSLATALGSIDENRLKTKNFVADIKMEISQANNSLASSEENLHPIQQVYTSDIKEEPVEPPDVNPHCFVETCLTVEQQEHFSMEEEESIVFREEPISDKIDEDFNKLLRKYHSVKA